MNLRVENPRDALLIAVRDAQSAVDAFEDKDDVDGASVAYDALALAQERLDSFEVVRLVPPPGETAEYTDLRNAERLVEMHGRDLAYVKAWNKWLGFNGELYEVDATGIAERCAVETSRAMVAESLSDLGEAAAATAANDPEAKTKMKAARDAFDWATQSQQAKGLRSMLEIAKSHKSVAVSFDGFNRDPWLLNVRNGTLDLNADRFGLRPHRREDRLTKMAPVAFDPSAKCPTWERFLRRTMNGNDALITYLQRLVGYSLTALIVEQLLVFSYGEGKNGKSTFYAVLRRLLGSYAVHAGRGVLFDSNKDRHSEELTVFWGSRLATFPEIAKGQSFDEALIKDLTGGEPVRARRMRENSWEFMPTHKLFLHGNHKPIIRGTDEGIWRRIKLVPWTVYISAQRARRAPRDEARRGAAGHPRVGRPRLP